MEAVEENLHAEIIRAGMGDIRAFESLVRRYYRLAFGYAISILKDYHLAEDAVQECFTEVHKSLRNLKFPAAFPSLLKLVVRKQCDRLTRKKRPGEVPYEDRTESRFESPESQADRREREAEIQALVKMLPPKQRVVTELYYMEGLSQDDISQFLKIKPSAVRKRLFDARKRLKKEMAMATDQETDSAIRRLFSNRIAPDLLEKLLSNPSLVELQGEERQLTVLFADAVKITDKQNRMALRDFFTYMNNHFSILFNIILENKGFIDKIIGDEFMALWGTPANPKDHATLACYTAIEMQSKLRALAKEKTAESEQPFRISIGINTGNALIGNFGPPQFLQYTPLGDTINFGARLEEYARKYGVEIAIGEDTYENAKANIIARKLDVIDVRQMKRNIGVYELVSKKSDGVSDDIRHKLEAFEKGYDEFTKENIDKARKHFLTALEASEGTDVPSLIYLQRCFDRSSSRT